MPFPTFEFDPDAKLPDPVSDTPPSETLMRLLRDSKLFSLLDDDELVAVARCVVESTANAGSVVIRQGTPGQNLYLVASGRLRVEKEDGGKRLLLGELGPRDTFGEMSLIHPVPTSATVTATDDTALMSISRLDLDVLLNWNPILAAKMWRSFTEILADRLREMNERMVARFGGTA